MICITQRPSVAGLVWPSTIRRRAARLMTLLDLQERELSIVLTDDDEISELNTAYRGKDGPTDVLSFPQMEGEEFPAFPGECAPLGDIVISLPTAQRQVAEGCLPRIAGHIGPERTQRWNLREETSFLMIHGLLHLVGFDHMTEEDALVMEAREAELLSALLRL